MPIIIRILKWIGSALLVVVGVAGVSFYLLSAAINGEDIRALLDREVRAATGRSLTIEGTISIQPGLLPVVDIEAVSLGNAAWSDTAVMLQAEHMFGQFSLWQLLKGHFVLEEVSIEGVSLLLETDAEGRNNWDFAGVVATTVDASSPLPPSLTASDQINDILSSLLSITSYVDEFYINDMSVRYTRADTATIRAYDIAWVGMESADQDRRLVLDIGAGADRRNQTLHLEIYDGADFLNGLGDFGLTLAIDADKWKAQLTGGLTPERNETTIDLDLDLEATDVAALYRDLGEMAVLPAWPDLPERLALDFKTLVSGTLGHPVLENAALTVDGKRGSRISIDGAVDDLLGKAGLEGRLSVTINDPARYGAVLFDAAPIWKGVEDADLGSAVITGDLGGRLSAPYLKNATLSWGTEEAMRVSAQNLGLGVHPFMVTSDVSITLRDQRVISGILAVLMPPPFAALPPLVNDLAVSARLNTSSDGRLDIDDIDLSTGQGSALKAGLTGSVTDLLGAVDPSLFVTIGMESDRLIHKIAAIVAPDVWPKNALPLGPLTGSATLIRGESGKLEMRLKALDFGDPDFARISVEGVILDLQSLDGVEMAIRGMAHDGPRPRRILGSLLPDSGFLDRLPPLDEIAMTGNVRRNGQEWSISSLTMNSGGLLPLSASLQGVATFEPSPALNGSVMIEGADVYALRDAVANILASEALDPNQFERPFLPSTKGFRVAGSVTMAGDKLTVSDFLARFGASRLSAELHATDVTGRPKVKLAIANTSLYLPEINDLLIPDDEGLETGEEARIFQTQDYDFSALADFDMSMSATGELISISSPVFNSLEMALDLERGRLFLRHFLGTTTEGNFSLSGDWNVAGAGAPDMNLDLDIKGISLGSLLHRTQVADWLREAPMSGVVRGRLRGTSSADLAASFTGQVDLSVGPGEIDKSVVDWLGGDLIGTIYSKMNPFAETIPYSQLLCAEARLPFVDGVSEFERKIALETKRVALMASGRIDLGQESIDLSLASTPKEGFGPALGGSLIALKGRLDDPEIVLDTWGASKKAVSVGASILTGGVSSLLETIFDRLTRETNLCQAVSGVSISQ